MTNPDPQGIAALPGWGVVLLAREPAALVLANLRWHLSLGASAIHLYLDDPDDPVAGPAAALPGVTVTCCDAAFWRARGGRPALQTRRQTIVATEAYRACALDWLVNLDADEFVFSPRPLAEELAGHADLRGYLSLPNLERAYTRTTPETLFEGVFRVPTAHNAPLPPALAGLAPYVARGVSGHAAGKACVRTGLDVVLQPHAARAAEGPVPSRRAQSAVTLHFDGLTPLHWLVKLRRYAGHDRAQWGRFLGEHRRAQLEFALAHADDAQAMRAFHDRLKVCPDPAALESEGLIRQVPFEPASATRLLPGKAPDLSTAAFDAELRRSYPDLCRGL